MRQSYEIIQPRNTPYWLPLDLWKYVFFQLSFFGLAKMECIAPAWNRSSHDQNLWLKFYQEYFPERPLASVLQSDPNETRFAFKISYLSLNMEERKFLSEFWLKERNTLLIKVGYFYYPACPITAYHFLEFLLSKKDLTKFEADYFVDICLAFGGHTKEQLDVWCKPYQEYINASYRRILYLAMKNEQWNAVSWLLEKFTYTFNPAELSQTNLILIAIQMGHPEVAIKIIAKKENVNFYLEEENILKKSLLTHALKKGYVDVAKALVQCDRFQEHTQALLQAIEFSQSELIDILQRYLLRERNVLDAKILFQVISLGALEIAHTFLNGNNFNYVCEKSGNTSFHLAAAFNHPVLLQALIHQAENANVLTQFIYALNQRKFTPLAIALKRSVWLEPG